MSALPDLGPDGYPISPDHPRAAEHRRLNDYLLSEEQRSTTTPFDVGSWRKLARHGLASHLRAVLERLTWLYEHDAELAQAHLARMCFVTLLRVLHSLKSVYAEPELRALLDQTVPLLGRIEPYGPVEHVVEYLKSGDLTPELCQSLRSFQANLRPEMSVSQASMQSLRQQLHLLLWLDEWEPLDPARCWSECVRRDFRTFSGERRGQWRALLKHLRGNAPVRMPGGWAHPAELLLNEVGLEDFREQLHLWFAPFRSGQAVPLSVAGSHVLKGLIWYSAVARDDDLKECCLWLLDARWKQQRNTEKVLVALGELGIGKEELRERKLIKPPPSNPTPRLIEKLKSAVFQVPEHRIQGYADGELIVVQGQLHFYRLLRSSGRIERVTDNAELVLNWPAIPDSIRLFLHRECDSPPQADYRAHLLMYDGIYGSYFAVK